VGTGPPGVRMEVGLRGRRSKAEQDLLRLVRLRLEPVERGRHHKRDNERFDDLRRQDCAPK